MNPVASYTDYWYPKFLTIQYNAINAITSIVYQTNLVFYSNDKKLTYFFFKEKFSNMCMCVCVFNLYL